MKNTEEEIVMYSDAKAAQIMTLTGWVSRDGRFWGKDEHMARYSGCTHTLCKCGAVIKRGYIRCDACSSKEWAGVYTTYPFKEWDHRTPLYDNNSDKYFFNADDIEEYLDEEGLTGDSLQLVYCYPNHLCEIDYSFWEDVLPEDCDLPKELMDLVEKVNEYCRKSNPISWSPGKIRTEYKQ
jgi:hypothetical protein